MCFRLSAFRRYGVREFWMTNVVDDCSLADRLIHLGARIRLSGDAVLMTEAQEHDLGSGIIDDSSILFLKFCIPYQWVLLGVLACPCAARRGCFGRALACHSKLGWLVGRAGLCRVSERESAAGPIFRKPFFLSGAGWSPESMRLHVRLGLSGYHPRGRSGETVVG